MRNEQELMNLLNIEAYKLKIKTPLFYFRQRSLLTWSSVKNFCLRVTKGGTFNRSCMQFCLFPPILSKNQDYFQQFPQKRHLKIAIQTYTFPPPLPAKSPPNIIENDSQCILPSAYLHTHYQLFPSIPLHSFFICSSHLAHPFHSPNPSNLSPSPHTFVRPQSLFSSALPFNFPSRDLLIRRHPHPVYEELPAERREREGKAGRKREG